MHEKRYIAVGRDGRMYVGIGAPDNVVYCGGFAPASDAAGLPLPPDTKIPPCAIISMNLNGTDVQNFATGKH
jgi:hypothetical protein